MKKYPNLFLIVVLLLGWIFDFLFWKKPVGINFAIFILISLTGGFCLLLANRKKPALKSLLLLLPLLFFLAMTFIRQEPLTLFLAYTFSIFSMGVLAVTFTGGRWPQYSLLDYFARFFRLIGSLVAGALTFLLQLRKEQADSAEPGKRLSFTPILRGILITLPIVAVFTALLASADLVFNQRVKDFFDVSNSGSFFNYAFRIFIILLWAYLLAGTFIHASSKSQDEKLLGDEKPIIKPFVGFTESAIVLGSVSFLFLLFVIIQFRYFFGGNVNIGVKGYSYSQYARSGFNELVAVAFLSLVMILGLSTVTKRENNFQKRLYSGLSIAIVALVMVILDSAFQRVGLAIDWHGFSRLRVYPQIFMIWVAILFVAVVVLEILRKERYFAFAAVIAAIGFATSLSLFNVDDAIVRYNILRATQKRNFNVSYLTTLSLDAIPALADKFSDASLPTKIHEGIGAALYCHLRNDPIENTADDDWRSFNLSRWNAQKVLSDTAIQFNDYSIHYANGSSFIITPGQVSYQCMTNVLGAGDSSSGE